MATEARFCEWLLFVYAFATGVRFAGCGSLLRAGIMSPDGPRVMMDRACVGSAAPRFLHPFGERPVSPWLVINVCGRREDTCLMGTFAAWYS